VIDRLDSTIKAAGIPIDGLYGQQGSIVVQFRPEATAPQQATAATIVAGFDWSQAAHDAWLEDQRPQRKAIRQAAAGAVADNDAYLALANPNNAAVVAQVRRLTQQNNAIIRRLVQID
jgi:hypothetical protein